MALACPHHFWVLAILFSAETDHHYTRYNYTHYYIITTTVLFALYTTRCHQAFVSFYTFLCFSFQVGDLVLIILDERHDNYVLFTVGPTLYFLHSESLTALDLKPGQPFSKPFKIILGAVLWNLFYDLYLKK